MAAKTIYTYPLTGGRDFPIPFEYLARKFVQVSLKGGAGIKPLALNTDYRFTSKSQITTTSAIAPTPEYDTIEIRRYTSATERLVDFNDGSILRAYDLNLSQIQTLHVAEEARDLTADTIGVNQDGNLDARNRRIVNVAQGEDPTDAVNVYQLQFVNGSAGQSAAAAAASAAAAEGSMNAALNAQLAAKASEVIAVASANTSLAALDAAKDAADRAHADADYAHESKEIIEPLVPIVEQASKDALQASKDAAQAVIDVKSLGAVPIGSIMLFPDERLPAGYLELNGQTFDALTYPELAVYLGTNKVPDWRDRTVKHIGTDLTAGETKEWETPAHSHDRGTMDIQGRVGSGGGAQSLNARISIAEGAFDIDGSVNGIEKQVLGDADGYGIANFQASRNWTGRTSEEGNGTKVEVDRVGGVYAIKAAGKISDEGLAQLNGVLIHVAELQQKTQGIERIEGSGTQIKHSGFPIQVLCDHFSVSNGVTEAKISADGNIKGAAWGGDWLSNWLSEKGLHSMVKCPEGFTVVAATNPRIELANSLAGSLLYMSGSTFLISTSNGSGGAIQERLTLDAGGTMQIQGAGYAIQGWVQGSDERLKDNLESAGGLAKLSTLTGYVWDWNFRDGGRSAGVSAQQLQKVLPEAVDDSRDYLSVNYSGVIALLVNAVNELKAELDELKSKLKED